MDYHQLLSYNDCVLCPLGKQFLVTVPGLLGVGRALQVSLSCPREAFRKLFHQTISESEETVWKLDQETTNKLFKMVSPLFIYIYYYILQCTCSLQTIDLLTSYPWRTLDSRLDALDSVQLLALGYPYRFISNLAQFILTNLIRDLVNSSPHG